MERIFKVGDQSVTFTTDLSQVSNESFGILVEDNAVLRVYVADVKPSKVLSTKSKSIKILLSGLLNKIEHYSPIGAYDARRLYLYFQFPGISRPTGVVIQSTARTYPEYDLKTMRLMGINTPFTTAFLKRQMTHLVGQIISEKNGQ